MIGRKHTNKKKVIIGKKLSGKSNIQKKNVSLLLFLDFAS
jgi:hypothetical protein